MSVIERLTRSTAFAICPRADRRWLEAMLAEANAAPARFSGSSAMWSIVLTALGTRIDSFMAAPVRWIAAIALQVAIICALLSRTDIEFHGVDDDVCLRFAFAATVTLLTIVFGAIGAALLGPVRRRNAA